MDERLLLRVHEAAHTLGVSRAKAYELIADRIIPSIRVGRSIRVPAKALQEWIDRQLVDHPSDTA